MGVAGDFSERGDVSFGSLDVPTLSEAEINSLLKFAQKLAFEAGGILREGFFRRKEIAHKSGRELVTSADLASEKFIRNQIESTFPGHIILAEEYEQPQSVNVEYLWVVDPLDGTNNFAHGFPFFCVSIALVHRGILVLGVIYDPIREEIFWATALGDAYLNGERIRVSEIEDISGALLATGFPYDLSPQTENNLDNFIRFSYAAQGIRRAGSAALDLAYVAAGRLDGFWELKLRPWDMAAGALVVKRAGGIVTDFSGKPWDISSDRIVAANPHIHPQMMQILNAR